MRNRILRSIGRQESYIQGIIDTLNILYWKVPKPHAESLIQYVNQDNPLLNNGEFVYDDNFQEIIYKEFIFGKCSLVNKEEEKE